MIKYFFVVFLFCTVQSNAQVKDSVVDVSMKDYPEPPTIYILKDSIIPLTAIPKVEYVYIKPKAFSFITNIPKDIVGFTKYSFKKDKLKSWATIAGGTAFLLWADRTIAREFRSLCERNNISNTENFSPLISLKIGGKQTNVGKIPRNLNTAIYNFGQGSSGLLIAGGFFIMGKIKKNNRALQTANQLAESFITLGILTQAIKFSTGRENPSDVSPQGAAAKWRPFPRWGDFQKNKTKYDAFPSGHLATFVNVVTIIGENYPEHKWIKPVGYSLAGLVGLSMINNNVHWASDYPLAIGLGYGLGKFLSKKNRIKVVH